MNKGAWNRNVMNSLWRHRMMASSWNYLIAGIIGLFTGIFMNQKYLCKKPLCNPG